MIIVKPAGSAPCHRSEREFMRAMHDSPGVYLASINVPNSTAPGAFTREVDGVFLAPHGIYTVEVKGVRASGELRTPRMDAWTVEDGDTSVTLPGRPHAQALAHSKYLASFLKDTGVAPGWITAVLALVGDGIRLPEDVPVHVIDNVHVVVSAPGVGQVLREHTVSASQRELSVEVVQQILATFECHQCAPTEAELLAEGFRREEEIAAEVEVRRQQAREEFLAATQSSTVAESDATEARPVEPPTAGEPVGVADGPSCTEWWLTEERYAAALAVDEELVETGAFVDGVPLHRRLVSYAERKGMSLADVVAVVQNPVEVLGEANDTHLLYCGEQIAVSVRALDGLAMLYKPVVEAKAERQGATVNGVQISAKAAKQANNQFKVSLEAVSRIVTEPEERWWVPGTTDIAHARGEFVAVTAGHLGPVQYLLTRALAVSRAQPHPTEKPEPTAVDTEVDGVTVRASAVGWCNRRSVPLATIAQIAAAPQQTWPGHSPNMEVRTGAGHALLVEVGTNAVVAVMSPAEAVEYRDGVLKDGVRLSGRCIFLAKRRKMSVDDLIAAYRHPDLIARAPGTGSTVYVGAEVAVTVLDEGQVLTDFTFAGHARSMVRRGELVAISLSEATDDQAAPALPGQRSGEASGPHVAGVRDLSAHRAARPSPMLLDPRRAATPSHARAATSTSSGTSGASGGGGPSPLVMPRKVRRTA